MFILRLVHSTVDAVVDEVAVTKEAIAGLEKNIADEGAARKEENAAFVQEQSELSAAVKLLENYALMSTLLLFS